jgi:hypothetical protein
MLVAFFILFTLMKMADDSIRMARLLSAIAVFATTGVLLHTLLPSGIRHGPVPGTGKTSAQNIRLVDFKSKPNVYFIGFDSIWPKTLLQAHMGIDTTPYNKVLDAKFRRFPNFFANRIVTRKSLNALLALDMDYYQRLTKDESVNLFFPGLAPSPLLEIFKYNGYETTTLYDGLYFGAEKGPHVNNYLVNRTLSVCDFVASELKAYTFWGYCALVRKKAFILTLDRLGIIDWMSPINFLSKQIQKAALKDSPQFFLAYIYAPGHTNKLFDRKNPESVENYKQSYLQKSKLATDYLEEIISLLDKEDPNAILYVFGDHGPLLSRKDIFEDNPAFFVQDRFGIYGGIYPPDRCTGSISKAYSQAFLTLVQGAHMIIACLSGGENAYITPEEYRLPKLGTKTQLRYEDYLYE